MVAAAQAKDETFEHCATMLELQQKGYTLSVELALIRRGRRNNGAATTGLRELRALRRSSVLTVALVRNQSVAEAHTDFHFLNR